MLKIFFFLLWNTWECEIECVNKNIFKMKCFFHSVLTHKDTFNLPLKATVKKKKIQQEIKAQCLFL